MPGWGARHGAGRGRGRGGAQPRRIRRFLEPALLLLIHRSPAHGYALAEGLRELGLETYPTDISAIYRILNELEAQELVISNQDAAQSAGPPRRVYTLTEQGDAYLRAWVEDLRETDRLLHRFLQAFDAHQQEHRGGGASGAVDRTHHIIEESEL